MTEPKDITITAIQLFVEGIENRIDKPKYSKVIHYSERHPDMGISQYDIDSVNYEDFDGKASGDNIEIQLDADKSMKLKNNISFEIKWKRYGAVELDFEYPNPKIEKITIGAGTPVYSYASNCVRGVCGLPKNYYVNWSEIVPPATQPVKTQDAPIQKPLALSESKAFEPNKNTNAGGSKKYRRNKRNKSKKSRKTKSTKKRT